MSEGGQYFLLFLAAGIFLWFHFRKKKIPLTGEDVALKLGLTFKPEKTNTVQPKLNFINRLQFGKRHYAYNVFEGTYKGQSIRVFDFCYEVEVINGKSSSFAEDHYSFYTLKLPASFEEVTIYKEGWISKLKQLAGANDIDFESHEFSKTFRVRSPNPRFAYDFCNARMIEYLLKNKNLSIEIDRDILCISFETPLKFEDVEKNLQHLIFIRKLMPEYLF